MFSLPAERILQTLLIPMESHHTPAIQPLGDRREHWIGQAHKLAERLILPRSFIEETAHIIEGAFGREWLACTLEESYRHTTLIPKEPHELATLFGVAGKNQVAELMELAIYLKRLSRSPRIQEVIGVMRDNYATGFLQLAYAYRFLRANCKEIELEPTSERGKADIAFNYMGRPYLVECYVPRIAEKTNSLENLKKCAEMIFRASESCPIPLRISVRLKAPVTTKQGNQMGWSISKLLHEIEAPYHLKWEHELAEFDVRPVLPDDAKDFLPAANLSDLAKMPDAIFNSVSVPTADIERVRLGERVREIQGHRLLLWRPQDERDQLTEDEYSKQLLCRLSSKIRQTKRADDAGRVVIAELEWFAGDIDRSHRIGRRLQERLVHRFENFAAVFLVERSWARQQRYKYSGLLIGGKECSTIPNELFAAINSQEQELDILADWH